MHISQQKNELRKQTLSKRDALSIDDRISKSLQASELAAQHIPIPPNGVVSGFFPIRSEIDPRPLMDHLRIRGAVLCLPVVIDKTTIIFRELTRTGTLIDTGFGTRGPDETATVLDPGVMIMPLAAFDLEGGRIGYGAGHYDRAIAKLDRKGARPTLIGLAFECQCIDRVPVEAHDQPLDAIVTENGFRQLGSG